MNQPSMGKYYNANIKGTSPSGPFGCRTNRPPECWTARASPIPRQARVAMTTFTGFTNVFIGKDGTKYLSGVIHDTANNAVKAQSNPKLKGKVVGVAQVTWEEKPIPGAKP